MTQSSLAFVISLVLFLVIPTPAAAQSTAGAANLQIPPDVRAEGMGRVWAPLDSTPFSAWSNVGGLGFLRGVNFAKMESQLVPELADDVLFDYYSIVVGYASDIGPVPVTVSLGLNKTDLDYGESVITDPGSPDPIGTFRSFEDTRGYTLAVGVGEVVGVGVGRKETEVKLGPDDLGEGEATAWDYGILARSPYLVYDSNPFVPFSLSRTAHGHISLRALGAMAWSNRGDAISLSEELQSDPLPEIRRESIGLELKILPIAENIDFKYDIFERLFRDTHALTVSAGIGRSDSLIETAFPDSASKNEREGIVTYDGFEIRLFDVISYRRGTIFDDGGEIKGTTKGWGLSFLGYFGVDFAEIPQFRELERVDKMSVWMRIPLD